MRGACYRYVAIAAGSPALPALTEAEREVVTSLGRGWDNGAIAAHRGTSVNTVGNQIAAVFQKLGVASRFELAELVARLGVEDAA